jgi:glycine cleavage system aminomethyltransferase T
MSADDAAAVAAAVAADVAAVRASVALGDGAHVAAVRASGPGAQDLLDRASPRDLFVRAGQMLHTLLLDGAGAPIADVYLCCDEDDYLVLAEGLDGPALAARLAKEAGGLDVEIADLTPSHAILTLDGPYAWELLADVTSPDVIGLPYLGFFHEGRFTCFRGGKTGEYGYELLVPREGLAELRRVLLDAGRRYELREASRAALDLCRLEAGFFNVRREARPDLTPIELQLQWRVGADRAYRGAEAVAARRRAPRGRVTTIASEAALAAEAAVLLDGERVGTVLHAGPSHTRGDWIGLALLEPAIAHAGLGGLSCGGAPARTISAPAVNNRSLYVDPQRHAWATRDREAFPPLVRPRWS